MADVCNEYDVELCPRTHTMTPVMADERDNKLKPLLDQMRWRRTGAGSPYKINQAKIGRELGKNDSSHISRLESGERSLYNLSGHDLYILLRGYGYSPSDIKGIVATYNFNTPPQLLDPAEPRTVVIVSEGGISQPRDIGEVEVPLSSLHNADPSTVRERTVQPHDLATAKAQAKAEVGSNLIVSYVAQPMDESLVIVECEGGIQALAVWPVMADWVTPYRMGGPHPAMPIDADSKIAGVVLSVNQPQKFILP